MRKGITSTTGKNLNMVARANRANAQFHLFRAARITDPSIKAAGTKSNLAAALPQFPITR